MVGRDWRRGRSLRCSFPGSSKPRRVSRSELQTACQSACRLPGTTTRTPVGAKSRGLRVATTSRCTSAVAAISRSAPVCPSRADSRTRTRASAASKGTILSANVASVSASQPRSAVANPGSFSFCISIPRSISPSVTTLRNSTESVCSRSQCSTFGARSGLLTAETTLVWP